MGKYFEMLHGGRTRADLVFAFMDITDSTEMKSKQPEVSWLDNIVTFYDFVSEEVESVDGTLVKFLGDGALAVFEADRGHDAVNCAVKVQERIKEERASNIRQFSCSIGIASGEVVCLDLGERGADYLGSTVDRAARLSSGANAGAIFIDRATSLATMVNRISSNVGAALGRGPDDYLSSEQDLPAKGFANPIRYLEVIWDAEANGVRTKAVSEMARAPRPSSQAGPASGRTEWRKGKIAQWKTDLANPHGFIVTPEEEWFFFDLRFVVTPSDTIAKGSEVWFSPREPLQQDKNRVASLCLVMGSKLEVTLNSVRTGFGFANIEDAHGERGSLFVSLGELSSTVSVGQPLTVSIGENEQGPRGEP